MDRTYPEADLVQAFRRLEFVLTEKCNSRCVHCQGEHSPEKRGVMELQDGITYLEEVASVTKLDSFMVFGGEPMLYAERTIKFSRKAKELGIPEIELITNGFWGEEENRARSLAAQLKDAGVNEVLISVDAFHLLHIPLEWPRSAALACLAAGIDSVRWNVAILESEDALNRFDRQTSDIMRVLAPLGLETHINKVCFQGRARKTLSRFFSQQSLEGACPEAETALVNPTCVTLDARGWASICWSLSIGNAKKQALSRILTDYQWQDNPIIEALVTHGPKTLTKLPQASGFHFHAEKYIDKCHLCMDIREFLKPRYPEISV